MDNIEHLFVYGTLAPGRPNEHILANVEGNWQEALIFGSLRAEGWGAELGFPGLLLDGSKHQIDGFLFSSRYLSEQWSMLDHFEGEEYQRVTVETQLRDGNTMTANVYALRV